jgi:hypothetical protein
LLREIAVEEDTDMARPRGEHEEGSGGVKIREQTLNDLPPLIRTEAFSGMSCGSLVEGDMSADTNITTGTRSRHMSFLTSTRMPATPALVRTAQTAARLHS